MTRVIAKLFFCILLASGAFADSFASGSGVPRSFWHPHGEPSDSGLTITPSRWDFTNRTDPWVQQMRNLRDVLLVDSYRQRSTPTPTPTPAPTNFGGGFFVITNPPAEFIDGTAQPDFDRTPLHPLRDYFSDVAGIYIAHGYKELGRTLHDAGMVVENLITRHGENRILAARQLARSLERAVAHSSDEAMLLHVLKWPRLLLPMNYGQSPISSSYYWGDYRLAAAYFAKGLRAAARNAAARRPLARRIPYVPQNLLITLTLTRYWNYRSARVDVRRSNGFGGFLTQNLYDPATGSGGSPSYSSSTGVTFSMSGGTLVTSGSLSLSGSTDTTFSSSQSSTGLSFSQISGMSLVIATPSPTP